ncbi:MAG: RecX family transcriptional regulator [Oscillospiraceae bacterium]|nr:RecX family transcriptional regulator [Oscillospiraceae bacterium]
MRIDSLSASADRAGKYKVVFSDGSVLRLYRQTVEDFGLYTGRELTETEITELRTAAGQMSAKMRAVRIVAASSVSKKDLQNRLVQKGEDPLQAKEAVKWMEELKLVDDRQTAAQVVSRCAAKGYGSSRAKQALYEKKIPKEYWEDALADYPDQTENILAFLRSHLRDSADRKDVKRAVDALLRRGHSYADVQHCLRQLSDVSLEEF